MNSAKEIHNQWVHGPQPDEPDREEQDDIETLLVLVEIQENGIIRRADTGYLIGRLSDDYEYERLKDISPEPTEEVSDE